MHHSQIDSEFCRTSGNLHHKNNSTTNTGKMNDIKCFNWFFFLNSTGWTKLFGYIVQWIKHRIFDCILPSNMTHMVWTMKCTMVSKHWKRTKLQIYQDIIFDGKSLIMQNMAHIIHYVKTSLFWDISFWLSYLMLLTSKWLVTAKACSNKTVPDQTAQVGNIA